MLYNEIKHILNRFKYEGVYKSVDVIRSGLINCTYKLTYQNGDKEIYYILQRINTEVFKDPVALMENIGKVTEHICAKLDPNDPEYSRKFLRFIKSQDDTYVFRGSKGNYWRSYEFIPNTTAHNVIEDPCMFYEAGVGFGEFQKNLFDFPAEELVEVIPNFHNTKIRFFDFVSAIAADCVGRAANVEKEIDFLFDRRKMMNSIVDKLDCGELPVRVTHNDTKLNNVLIDNSTHKAVCVIDLDTVMPGSSLYDYGDAIRYGASTAAEDEPDISKITIDMELFKLFTRGFLKNTSDIFEKEEILAFPLGVKVMTCEIAMRFLTDYINGDTYFHTDYPEHNLVRARAQMKLLEEIEAKYDEMTDYIKSLI